MKKTKIDEEDNMNIAVGIIAAGIIYIIIDSIKMTVTFMNQSKKKDQSAGDTNE